MSPSGAAVHGTARGPRLRTSVVAGVVSGLLVLCALGALVVLTRPDAAWSAQVVLLVRPSAEQSDASTAGYYENLSSGLVVQTYAEVLRSRLGGANNTGKPAVEVSVLPETFLLRIVAEAPTQAAARTLEQQLGSDAVATIDALGQPYALRIVDSAADNVTRTGGLDPALLGVVALGSVLYGLAVQQAVWVVQGRRRQRAARESAEEPDDVLADEPWSPPVVTPPMTGTQAEELEDILADKPGSPAGVTPPMTGAQARETANALASCSVVAGAQQRDEASSWLPVATVHSQHPGTAHGETAPAQPLTSEDFTGWPEGHVTASSRAV